MMNDIVATPPASPTIRMHENDNVLIARVDLRQGLALPEERLACLNRIPAGHKVAARDIAKGEAILKYNTVIGFAAGDIRAGTLLHRLNMEFREFERDYAHAQDYRPVQYVADAERASFMGIVRDDGRVATRNFVGIVSTVNCSATVSHRIADWFSPERLAEYGNIDGVAAFTHSTGCGMELSGEPMDLLRRTLAGYIRHPNLAAVLVVGLGCERNQINTLFGAEKLTNGTNLKSFVMQDTGGTRKTIEAGIAAIRELLPDANRVTRVAVPASHVSVGLQCGGSDAFSSITANPALGAAMDILVRHGGTAILSETPEIYGVEHTLTRRAATREIGEKLVERIRWWKDVYALGRDVQINGVVSPGNQAGGLANILEKSLGSAMKGGSSPMMEVYKYAEPVRQQGFVFMDTPGYDPVSATGQIAGGANVVCFTTGRGSAFGCKPAPSIKLATNSPMFRRLEEDMDINCGEILDGTATMQEMGEKIFHLILDTCSGKKTKSEEFGLGDHEFVPWQIGITG
jgi:altronate hydrolase